MIMPSILLALSALSAAVVSAAPAPRSAQHVVDLARVKTSPGSSKALLYNRANMTARLSSVENGAGYAVPITFGSQSFTVLFDTGSSDLWVPGSDFTCLDHNGFKAPGQCGFDHRFQGALSGGTIPDQNFYIQYADEQFLVGSPGYEDVTLAGVKVPHQEAGLVSLGYFRGNGDVDGLMGFSYPFLTSAFKGTDPSVDNKTVNQAAYNPFFFNAVNQKLIDNVFTLALGRGKNAGTLSLGGVPDNVRTASFASTPLEIYNFHHAPSAAPPKNFSYYTITPGSYSLNGKLIPNTTPVIVDSGTTLTYLPSGLVRAINAAFEPPSRYIEDEGLWENYCNAKPPQSFSVSIGGQDFPFNAEDVLLPKPSGYDASTNGCVVGIQEASEGGTLILGESFLRNVVAVFDVGAEQMRFTKA